MSETWWKDPEWHVFEDIWYVVHAKIGELNNCYCDFVVYEMVGLPGYGHGPVMAGESDTPTESFLHGYVKWDGCSNWHFDEQDRIMLHFCGVKRATDIGELFRRIYQIALAEFEAAGTYVLDPETEFVVEKLTR